MYCQYQFKIYSSSELYVILAERFAHYLLLAQVLTSHKREINYQLINRTFVSHQLKSLSIMNSKTIMHCYLQYRAE
uniref:Uncharacterized protein n=1 Tax=Pararge aegeria TaxID=116150 RepID=S4PMI2_9NEOP